MPRPKRKADSLGADTNIGDAKKVKQEQVTSKQFGSGNLLDSDSGSDDEAGGALVDGGDFKINEDYAKRFEYNKKREERSRCMSLLCAHEIILMMFSGGEVQQFQVKQRHERQTVW